MTHLRLDSLEISDFRIFHHLEIAKLGRVNLITGKNSVGKTCLLEALRLYANAGSPSVLRQLLAERDQLYRLPARRDAPHDSEIEPDSVDAIRYLFHNGGDVFQQQPPIRIGPLHDPQRRLSIEPTLLVTEIGADRVRRLRRLAPSVQPAMDLGLSIPTSIENTLPGLSVKLGSSDEQVFSVSTVYGRTSAELRVDPPLFTARYVPAQSLESGELRDLWEKVTLTELESTVLQAMNVVAPRRIEGINIVGARDMRSGDTVIVKLQDEDQPVTLRSLGAGLVRAFGVALALVRSKGGMLLIDEIDSGLHYSVQYGLWQLMLSVAQQLNIQIFATTHSWDAVASFQQATKENKGVDGMLVRLDQRAQDIVATCFDEHRLAIATREQIEVR